MKKLLKILAVLFLIAALMALGLYITFIAITSEAKLDTNKLINYGEQIVICDEEGNEISNTSLEGKRKSVLVCDLQQHTIDAFIASEDAKFYKHNGLNYKRMVKAFFTNIAAGSFKEGASTISQQLIKNTHLSNDKTIKRKLIEIKLTKKLEKLYEKDQILEMYLNTIYFGHNCYGLQSAANFYFGKNAEDLTLEQSATLVGLLSSPNNYSPFKNAEKSIQRRNLVLRSMLKNKFITQEAYEEEIAKPLSAVQTPSGEAYGDYVSAVFEELERADIDFYRLSDGCKITTYMNAELQRAVENTDYPCDHSVVVTSIAGGGVQAYKSTVCGAKRQPGSAIKPLLVYAPAIEEKLISPFTKINDEKIDFGGYAPENYDKKYHGYVTVAECIKQSYNIPAVKILNTLTLKGAEKYADKLNIALEEDEKNLSLALGGMKYGLSLQQLCNAYSAFANEGKPIQSSFIKEICDKNGNVVYASGERKTERAFSKGTCSLMNEMLLETAKSGTAKKLKFFDFDVAAKTGTCGNEYGNTDAYSISYTSEHCVGVWLGDKNNERLSVTGGRECCEIAKEILQRLYSDHTPARLDCDGGTETIAIDKDEYKKNNKIVLADDLSPLINKMSVKVLKDNIPQEKCTKFSRPKIIKPTISVTNNEVCIELCETEYYSYLIKKEQNHDEITVYDGKWTKQIKDVNDPGSYTYSVTPYYESGGKRYYGDAVIFPPVCIGNTTSDPQEKLPDIAYRDWFDE